MVGLCGGRVAVTIKFRFVWIDDNAERAGSFKGALDGSLRGASVETALEVIQVKETLLEDLNARVEEWTSAPPNLIMLDHSFATVPKRLFDLHGSALAHLLRIRLPNIPIVCVSGQKIESGDFNIEDLSEYTYLFEVVQIDKEENLERLFAIAQDFKQLCFPGQKPIRHSLVEVLLPPEADKSALLSVLPEEFEGTYVHEASPHRLARWVLNVLMKRPGFLYDSLETATFLGLGQTAFEAKVKPQFEAARYRGPFATDREPMWWSSALTDVLYGALPDHISLPPQEAGRRFHGIEASDFSRCGVTGEHTPPPEVVAYTDATASERRAVRHTFAIPLSEEASSVLGFSTRLRIRNERRGS
jgi:hypothetical protein